MSPAVIEEASQKTGRVDLIRKSPAVTLNACRPQVMRRSRAAPIRKSAIP